jgi:hypothetical protein
LPRQPGGVSTQRLNLSTYIYDTSQTAIPLGEPPGNGAGEPWLAKCGQAEYGPLRKAPTFYVLLAVGTMGGTALTLAPAKPISLLVLVAIVNGIAAAPFVIVVMIVSRNRPLMRESRNGARPRSYSSHLPECDLWVGAPQRSVIYRAAATGLPRRVAVCMTGAFRWSRTSPTGTAHA